MNSEKIIMQINSNPVIAAIRTDDDLNKALNSPVKVIFLLNFSVLKLEETIKICHDNKKIVFVHFDLVTGLGMDDDAVKYISSFSPDGIISTKNNILKTAHELGLFTVQRFFIVDSRSCDTMRKSLNSFMPDMVEIMPGLLFETIEKIITGCTSNVICGGMIDNKQTVIKLLSLGAIGISTSHYDLWNI